MTVSAELLIKNLNFIPKFSSSQSKIRKPGCLSQNGPYNVLTPKFLTDTNFTRVHPEKKNMIFTNPECISVHLSSPGSYLT